MPQFLQMSRKPLQVAAGGGLVLVAVSLFAPSWRLRPPMPGRITIVLPSGREIPGLFDGIRPSPRFFRAQLRFPLSPACGGRPSVISRAASSLGLNWVVLAQHDCSGSTCAGCNSTADEYRCSGFCGDGTYWASAWADYLDGGTVNDGTLRVRHSDLYMQRRELL
jgi:hypothetical protein